MSPVIAATLFALAVIPTAAAGDSLEQALSATFRITDGKISGTGFLVSMAGREKPDRPITVLFTAAHLLEPMNGPECTIILRHKQDDGSYIRKETKLPIRMQQKPRWQRHPQLDIAALVVDLPGAATVKPLSLRQLPDEKWTAERKLRVGQEVFMPCFPAQLEGNEAGWPILRKGAIASHPLTPVKWAKTMLIDVSIFGGDSGAPIIVRADKEPVVVGMVLGMQRQTAKTTMPFEERTVHTPLRLAIAVQSPFLRDTVELLQERKAENRPKDK
jgi:hypothetical protein